MTILQKALTTALTLVIIDYSEEVEKIIIVTDANLKRWDIILMQIVKDRRCPCKYESRIWNQTERKYNTTKRECRAIQQNLHTSRMFQALEDDL
jgi:hypothetical protein